MVTSSSPHPTPPASSLTCPTPPPHASGTPPRSLADRPQLHTGLAAAAAAAAAASATAAGASVTPARSASYLSATSTRATSSTAPPEPVPSAPSAAPYHPPPTCYRYPAHHTYGYAHGYPHPYPRHRHHPYHHAHRPAPPAGAVSLHGTPAATAPSPGGRGSLPPTAPPPPPQAQGYPGSSVRYRRVYLTPGRYPGSQPFAAAYPNHYPPAAGYPGAYPSPYPAATPSPYPPAAAYPSPYPPCTQQLPSYPSTTPAACHPALGPGAGSHAPGPYGPCGPYSYRPVGRAPRCARALDFAAEGAPTGLLPSDAAPACGPPPVPHSHVPPCSSPSACPAPLAVAPLGGPQGYWCPAAPEGQQQCLSNGQQQQQQQGRRQQQQPWACAYTPPPAVMHLAEAPVPPQHAHCVTPGCSTHLPAAARAGSSPVDSSAQQRTVGPHAVELAVGAPSQQPTASTAAAAADMGTGGGAAVAGQRQHAQGAAVGCVVPAGAQALATVPPPVSLPTVALAGVPPVLLDDELFLGLTSDDEADELMRELDLLD